MYQIQNLTSDGSWDEGVGCKLQMLEGLWNELTLVGATVSKGYKMRKSLAKILKLFIPIYIRITYI